MFPHLGRTTALLTGISLLFFTDPIRAADVEWGEFFDEAAPKPAESAKTRSTSPAAAAPMVEAIDLDEPAESAPKKAAEPAAGKKPVAAAANKSAEMETDAAAPRGRSGKPTGAVDAADRTAPESDAGPADRDTGNVSLASFDLKAGDVLSAQNMEQHASLLTPGMQWGVRYGWRMKMREAESVEVPRRYREATEKHSPQVSLRADGLAIEGHVAGQPFPHLDLNDPKVAYKMMWNFYYNFSPTDDIAMRGIDTDTGTVGQHEPITVERHLVTDSYRKMYYNSRLYVDPKPVVPNPEGVRFKESVHPILEPFDLKGVGFTGYRYIDSSKQDDSWVYLPQLRRVRRLSSSQRSDALFGQDTDADSFGGYNGHIAWADYSYLGEQVILATMHAQNHPAKWQEPENWLWDDSWEPRRVYVVEAKSRLPQYAYAKRVLYIDKEAWVMPTTDSYDRAGQLWKSHYLQYQFRTEVGVAKRFNYEDVTPAVNANIIFDVQLQHATSTGIPRVLNARDNGTFTNLGSKMGVTEDFFTIAALVAAGK